MSYLKAYDKLIEVDFEPYKLTKRICDAGYFKTLDAGAIVRIGKTWTNFYGRWTSIYDLEGRCYDIHPYEVKEVTEKLETKETIEELCDEFVCESNEEGNNFTSVYFHLSDMKKDSFYTSYKEHYNFYGAIHIKGKGMIYVAKLNEKGELELL